MVGIHYFICDFFQDISSFQLREKFHLRQTRRALGYLVVKTCLKSHWLFHDVPFSSFGLSTRNRHPLHLHYCKEIIPIHYYGELRKIYCNKL